MNQDRAPILRLEDISKSFSGVTVLDGINLNLYGHEVLALMGENGAGKSTLMNILSGNLMRDSGKIVVNGNDVDISSPRQASELGIAIIHQELNVVPTMTVAQNLALGNEPKGRSGLVDKKQMREDALRKLSVIGTDINPDVPLGELGTGEQQMVEIAKAVASRAKILILDEPTASLSRGESERLFDIVEKLRGEGTGLIYISHRMEEVWRLADRVTVLRDGHTVATSAIADVDQSEIVAKMVGRKVEKLYDHDERSAGEVVLDVRDLRLSQDSPSVSLQVRAGEVVGVSGLVGAGRTEIARCVIGADKRFSGEVSLKGRNVAFQSPKMAIQHGVAYLPEDRKVQSIFPVRSVEDNISVSTLERFESFGMLRKHKIREAVGKLMQKVNIASRLQQTPIVNLSGGNQQKAIFARWMMRNPDVLILDEPTRGVDVGAKREIYELIGEQAAQGKAILMISSDLPEVLGISDRVLIIRQGSVVANLESKKTTEEEIMGYATGVLQPQRLGPEHDEIHDNDEVTFNE